MLKNSLKLTNSSFRRKLDEAGFSRTYLTYVRTAERVQRVRLHPGQQQVFNTWTTAFAGVTSFFQRLVKRHF